MRLFLGLVSPCLTAADYRGRPGRCLIVVMSARGLRRTAERLHKTLALPRVSVHIARPKPKLALRVHAESLDSRIAALGAEFLRRGTYCCCPCVGSFACLPSYVGCVEVPWLLYGYIWDRAGKVAGMRSSLVSGLPDLALCFSKA